MGGFKVPRRMAVITFEGTDYDGAEIRCAFDLAFKEFLALERLRASEDIGQITEGLSRFADDVIDGWNLLDDDGTPLPANADGFMTLPPQFGMLILSRWLEEVGRVPAPLGEPSSDGDTSAEQLTQTAELSPSPSSS